MDGNALPQLIREGGPVLVVLLVLSVATLALLLLKLWHLGAAGILLRVPEPTRLGEGYDGLSLPPPLARLDAIAAVTPSGRGRLEAKLETAARAELGVLRRGLRPLEAIASLAPLLGLLGTVLGMIRAFAELGLATGRPDPALLAGGIAEALINTAGGLVVAIMATVSLAFCEGRIERLALAMETMAGGILDRRRAAAAAAAAGGAAA
jgi:biopolymer transport protein ExbB